MGTPKPGLGGKVPNQFYCSNKRLNFDFSVSKTAMILSKGSSFLCALNKIMCVRVYYITEES